MKRLADDVLSAIRSTAFILRLLALMSQLARWSIVYEKLISIVSPLRAAFHQADYYLITNQLCK